VILRFLSLLLLCWSLGGEPARAQQAFTVAESFQVGRGVVVRALAVDVRRHHLWVGTSVGAIQVELGSGERLAVYTRDNALANEYVFAAFVDSRGDVWLGTNGGGVSRYSEGRWRTYFPLHGLADYWVYSFAEAPDGDVWIGTWAGLNRWSRRQDRFTTYLEELVNEWVYALAVDARGRLWVGTEGGLNAFDGRQWLTWTHAEGLGAPNRAGLPFSPNTGLGTRNRHDLNVQVDGRPSYNPNYVFSLVADGEAVWVGTWGGGVGRFDGRRFRNYTRDDGLPGEIVYALARDGDGRVWAGTDGGVAWFDGRRWRALTALPAGDVYALAAAPDGSVWAGMTGLVARIQPRH